MPGAPERHPGLFTVDLGGATIGQVILRRAKELSVPAAAGKAELGYLFLPEAWGFGYAEVERFEAHGAEQSFGLRPAVTPSG